MTAYLSKQLLAIIGLLLLTGSVLLVRGNKDRVPPSLPLAQMPHALGPWFGEDQAIAPNVLDVLGKGEFLNRVYREPVVASQPNIPVGLFIGYFPTQRSGQSIHSPQNCLPGSGWTFDHSGVTTFRSGDKEFRVGEYVISNAENRAEVLYWYDAQGQTIANDYSAKLHMLLNSVAHDRTDAALVRILTPIAAGENQAQAHDRVIAFAKRLMPTLPVYIPG